MRTHHCTRLQDSWRTKLWPQTLQSNIYCHTCWTVTIWVELSMLSEHYTLRLTASCRGFGIFAFLVYYCHLLVLLEWRNESLANVTSLMIISDSLTELFIGYSLDIVYQSYFSMEADASHEVDVLLILTVTTTKSLVLHCLIFDSC